MRILASLVLFCCCGWVTPAGAESDAATQNGRVFLVSLFDDDVHLLPEYRGARVFWLYHDNYLAMKVLATSHPKLAQAIEAAIRNHGIQESGKIEILFGESRRPLPFRQFDLIEIARDGERMIRTERLKKLEFSGWAAYADLRLFAAMALVESAPDEARRHFSAALEMWDGIGFQDAVVDQRGIYATYKLALAMIAADKLNCRDKLPPGLVAKLSAMQAESGGWITDYQRDGRPLGKANVETTCLAILALESVATDKPVGR